MEPPNYELLSYARAYGISTDHTNVTYWSRLNRSAILPVPVLATQWLCTRTPQYVFLREDLQTGNDLIDFTNTEAVDFNAKDYVELETLPNVAVELMKMDEPELRGPAVKPYLERVAPFAYMGNMNVQDPEVEEEPIWISVNFKFHFKEKLQITADAMRWLSKRSQYRFSSPLLPLEPEREPFEPTSELLTSIPESPLSRWSISETLSPASSLAPISRTASSPLTSRKRRVPLHFSSPLLPAAATAKRIKDIPFPDDLPLEAAPPTAYSQVLHRRDCQLASQMQQDAEITTSILQTENISEGDLALRVEVPVVVPLETAIQRRSRVKVGFPTNMQDIKGRIKEWRKGGNDWIIKWNPFNFAKEDVMMQQQGAECIWNCESDDMVIEMLTDNELEKMEDAAALQRSKAADWQLSDEVQNDTEDLRLKEDEDSNCSTSNYPPKGLENIETLEDLLEHRKSTNTHLAVNSNTDMRQINKFLPVNPFELYTIDSTVSDEKSAEDDPEEREQAEEKLREEKRHSDMINAAQTHEAAIKSLGTTMFDPETKVIVNTTFLNMNRTIYCDILECTSGLIAIERDYGPDEADILLSSSCGLLVYSFSQILQRELDGTRVAVKRAKDIFQRVQRLLILVRISPNISLKTQSDWTALADFMASLAGIRVFLVKDSESLDVVRWLINICQQFGGRGNGMADVETTWERFLRKVGVNAYAAQEILKIMPLKRFVECGHDERLNTFLELVGLKVLTTVTRVLNAPLSNNFSR
ncbi:uncharacterized protein V1513DRAFT_425789 [Lipomyces chichibuensis]|uniref:uncharacterized protein n=1 Tax=Lipomyces chichibuensis TaxID=1546026 RepID=UPI0033443347